MSSGAFDPLRILHLLNEHAVRFVVVGGIAAQLHGSPSATFDLDITPAADLPNLDRLAAVLRDLAATLRGASPDLPFRLEGKTLARGNVFTFDCEAGAFDILLRPEPDLDYERLLRNAVPMALDGVPVHVAAIDDLMRMKRAAGRPKDRVELEILGALREEMDRAGDAARKQPGRGKRT